MSQITTARNAKTTIYEVHKAGCTHLNFGHMEVMGYVDHEVEDAIAFTKDYAESQDGILATVGPCIKRGKREIYGDADY